MLYPIKLNFGFQDSYVINYQVENPGQLIGIKLNNDSGLVLNCTNKNKIKQCIIPKMHFNQVNILHIILMVNILKILDMILKK